MQLDHWGIEKSPFRSVPDANQFYPSSAHDEALARLEYVVDTHRRVGVLLGESGVGKSLTLRVARGRLARKGVAVVSLEAVGLTTREMLWQIAAGLGAAPREDTDAVRLWRLISDRIVENRLQGISTALVVDDAGQAGPDALTQLVRLARLDASPAARWSIVLAAEPQQAARWDQSLRDLVDLRIDLGPWSKDDTIGYVQSALVDAGRFDPVFDDDALRTLHELADGIPRRVARLADFALLASAAAKLDVIDAATIHAAHDELRWPSAEPVAY